MKKGQVFYSNQKNSIWKVWHEILEIKYDTYFGCDLITLASYGKDTKNREWQLTKKEFDYLLRKHRLILA